MEATWRLGTPLQRVRPTALRASSSLRTTSRCVGWCLIVYGEGYEVHEVRDGAELLVRIEDSYFLRPTPVPVDLFVTDIRMPKYTGLEIVSGLRGAGMHMPVVIMTAFGNAEARLQAEQLRAVLLDKPFKMEALRTRVRRLLNRSTN